MQKTLITLLSIVNIIITVCIVPSDSRNYYLITDNVLLDSMMQLPGRQEYKINDERNFYVVIDVNEHKKVTATLVKKEGKIEIWVDNSIPPEEYDVLIDATKTFTDKMSASNEPFFITSPDDAIRVLYVDGGGEDAAYPYGGYFSVSDLVSRKINKYSNQSLLIVIPFSKDTNTSNTLVTTLAHEYQHLSQSLIDNIETLWVNEGLSELAESIIRGEPNSGMYYTFSQNLNNQLNTRGDNDDSRASYASSYAFFEYLYYHVSPDTFKAIVHNKEHGIKGIEDALQKEENITFDDVFENYAKYLFQGDDSFYAKYQPNTMKLAYSGTALTYGVNVPQYGFLPIMVNCKEKCKMTIAPQKNISINGMNTSDGGFMWSGVGSSSSIAFFDTSHCNCHTLHIDFDVWYSLGGNNLGKLSYSIDGDRWYTIRTNHATLFSVYKTILSFGYLGKSNGWERDTADISFLAGKRFYLRFEHINNDERKDNGIAIDNLSIPEIGYTCNFNGNDYCNWEGEFVVQGNKRRPVVGVLVVQNESSASTYKFTENKTVSLEGQSLIVLYGLTQNYQGSISTSVIISGE